VSCQDATHGAVAGPEPLSDLADAPALVVEPDCVRFELASLGSHVIEIIGVEEFLDVCSWIAAMAAWGERGAQLACSGPSRDRRRSYAE
jgi:hypothetical protein